MSDYADLELDPRLVLGGYIETDAALREEVRPAVDAEGFKAAMRMLAGGVVMVTTHVEGRLWGLTISACCSISASPPRILISLSHTASGRPAVLETGRFGLSILRADQKGLADLGAVPRGPKYVDAFRESATAGSTMLAGALYHLDCSVDRTFEVGDHTLVIGAVEAVIAGRGPIEGGRGPLLYFDRAFHTLGEPLA
ncbi:MAG: flavin reductase family protein [Gaiellaceae bacterium]